jgi:hypothetical protein
MIDMKDFLLSDRDELVIAVTKNGGEYKSEWLRDCRNFENLLW